MNSEYILNCRECGFGLQAWFGTCVLYPGDYRKIVKAVRLGAYGDSARKALKETPMGVLDCDRVLLQCTECGWLETEPDLSVYGPKEPILQETAKWSLYEPFEGAAYAVPWSLKGYTLACRTEHTCSKCSAVMKIIREDDLGEWECEHDYEREPTEIACPKCGKSLWLSGKTMWDE